MRVHVEHVLRAEVGVLERQLDRLRRAASARLRRRQVVGVRGRRVAAHVAEDARAARAGGLLLLEDQDAGALAHHEAVAAPVEGARDAAVGERVHAREGRGGERRDRRLAAAGDDGLGVAVADQPLGHADRVRARPRRRTPCRTTARAGRASSPRRPRRRWPSAAGSRAARCGRRPAPAGSRAGCSSVSIPPMPVPITQAARSGSPGGPSSQPASSSASAVGAERELGEAVGAARLLDREVLLGVELAARGRSRPRCRTGRRSSARAACGRRRRAASRRRRR